MEQAILVGIQLPKIKRAEVENSLEELKRLAETAGAVATHIIVQRRIAIDPAYCIGEGKARELRMMALEEDIHTIIFDEDLKPVQQKNLEELIGTKIIDRTRLILDIFAQRARTREGILQVERAQLAYNLPRLSKKGIFLDSQTGGIGTRGPGERKLEIDQRRIRERISLLDHGIEAVRRQREVLRGKRTESCQPIVAIVGYTNAGKSTLLNTLTGGQEVYADDKLFATLDPTTRRVQLPGGRVILFTDTVGFISKLPHDLVAAFHATLEEITRADAILHLIDISHPDHQKQARTVMKVLKELNATHIPLITAYNKADMLSSEKQRMLSCHNFLLLSALRGNGTEELLRRIEQIVTPQLHSHRFTLPFSLNQHVGKIYDLSVVKKQEYTPLGTHFVINCTDQSWKLISRLINKDP